MPFPLNKPLSQEELQHRQSALRIEIGLSKTAVRKLQQSTHNLCEAYRAKRRFANLNELGFNSKNFVENNPKILDRRAITVKRKFLMVSAWLRLLQCDVDVHKLFISRPQLWSIGPRKMHIICLLALHISDEVTASRLCNMFTKKLEDVLCTYIDNQTTSFVKLYYQVHNGINGICTDWTNKTRNEYISAHRDKLPRLVRKKYFT